MINYKQAEQLIILAEECAEVQKEACKILRFGMQPENLEKLKQEIGDLLGIMEWVVNEHGFDAQELIEIGMRKQEKMLKWTSYQKTV